MSSAAPPATPTPATAVDVVAHVPCLGCGCGCDDIEVVVERSRIVEARRACPLGVRWFGDGAAPARLLLGGLPASIDDALDAAVDLLAGAARPLVYLAPEVSCEAQREGVAVADLLRATLDSVTSATALAGILQGQERGRATATLGEIRNRADVLLFWGVDPALRYPRYGERYAPAPIGTHVRTGRTSRVVIAVDVGADGRGPADADIRVALPPEEELATLGALCALVRSAPAPDARAATRDAATPGGASPSRSSAGGRSTDSAVWARAAKLVGPLLAGHYVVVVHDGEPSPGRDPERVGPLIALTQTLNDRTRAALSVLRAGGNRAGADDVTTWQTGFPVAVDFARGHPRYRPYDGTAAARLARGEIDAVLVVGALGAGVPAALAAALGRVPCVVIGPGASAAPFSARVAMDSAVAGIHEGGTALRMDDVPLPLRPLLDGPPPATSLVRALRERLQERLRAAPRGGAAGGAAARGPEEARP